MSLLPKAQESGLKEFSVVFTDHALNHMSQEFQGIMRDIHGTLKQVYQADDAVIIPGGGTYGMEAVARQFARHEKVLIVRNGWFSYRWTQILEMTELTDDIEVLKAQPLTEDVRSPFAPAPIAEVVAAINREKPAVIFLPHVETASGIMLPDDYIAAIGQAARDVGALLVADCIASGAIWLNMQALKIDVLISAPQKGWSGPSNSALVMLSKRALAAMEKTHSNSYACDLKRWRGIMQAYVQGGHAYHATLPTDALKQFHQAMQATREFGFAQAQVAQLELGLKVRTLLADFGFQSVAAPGYGAPGVVVMHTDRDDLHNGSAFVQQGIQAASGVPLMCDEADGFKTFRLGLFGLAKLDDIPGTVQTLKEAISGIL